MYQMETIASQLYEQETGNKFPSSAAAYPDWHFEYVKWLEQKVCAAATTFDPYKNSLSQVNEVYTKNKRKQIKQIEINRIRQLAEEITQIIDNL